MITITVLTTLPYPLSFQSCIFGKVNLVSFLLPISHSYFCVGFSLSVLCKEGVRVGQESILFLLSLVHHELVHTEPLLIQRQQEHLVLCI